jgi:diguanylate cyclase (GGDEF)-like protein/PAS domain S-box-containing protein
MSNPKDLIPQITDLLLDAVCVVNRENQFVYVSDACEAVFGYPAAEMVGRHMYDFIHPEDRDRTREAAGNVIAGTPHLHFRNRYVRKNGETVHIMWSARRLNEELRVGVARDVTALTQAESLQHAVYAISEAVHAEEDLLALFRRIHDIVGGLLPVGRFVVALKEGADETLDFPYAVESDGEAALADEAEVLCAAIVREAETSAETAKIVRKIERHTAEWLGVPLRTQSGVRGALVIRNRSGWHYAEKDEELLQYVSAQIATAIERKQTDLRLQHLALHDALTGLPNRALFVDRLNLALTRAQRNASRMALLYIDLNGFKEVNDRYGHGTGDALLREVAQRLRSCVRESDTVGRLGGDEFVIVLDQIATPESVAVVTDKIRAVLSQRYNVAGRQMNVTPSIGVALCPEHGDQAEALMRYADAAMYGDKGRA